MTRDPETQTRLLVEMPEQERSEFASLVKAAQDEYRARRLEEAVSKLLGAYSYQVEAQVRLDLGRFHKGFALHQLGLWMLELRQLDEAFRYFLDAFVEDSLSEAIRKQSTQLTELTGPASLMLTFNFSVAGSQLVSLARRLRAAVAGNRVFLTPEEALEACPLVDPPLTDTERQAAERATPSSEPFAPEWRDLGDFGTPMDERVFVGGSYAHQYLEPSLAAIRDQARQCGWDGVLVAEFKNRLSIDNRTKSLICLMGCRRAVFDLSESGGHQVEFDKLVDFGIREVLVVYNAEVNDHLRISTLTQAWFTALRVTPIGYRGVPELQRIVRDWLGCNAEDDEGGASEARRARERARALGEQVGQSVADQVSAFTMGEAKRRS